MVPVFTVGSELEEHTLFKSLGTYPVASTDMRSGNRTFAFARRYSFAATLSAQALGRMRQRNA